MNKKEEPNEDIIKRLNALIYLNIKREMKENKSESVREYILLLNSLGFRYNEIANIFGKSPTYIGSELTLMKKKGKVIK